MTSWTLLLTTAGAGGLGAGLRYLVDVLVMRGRRGAFPLGILVVNATGSFALGLLTGLAPAIGGEWVTTLGVGLLGGYTTFSTVSTETVLLGQRHRRDWAWTNLLGTLGICAFGAALGIGLGRLIAGWIPA
ncbi:fluoride efflux transporter FluC [Microbacterium sp. B2969]|uniref:Fluoride-specific ion channel FluC n=1 Tax=Microbacterium alkaliflavum TaxID=3248839 RepID=A0ABW7QBX6_9MICO